MKILHRDSLPRGGFAGLKETRLVRDTSIAGDDSTWDGLGRFVFLADARYLPEGETRMHSHKEIDVITVMVEGRLNHEGSMEDGKSLVEGQAQVQRAGGEGFSHNEVNPDKTRCRILQIWALPETAGEPSDYKFYELKENQLTRIYGGSKSQDQTFDSHTVIEVGLLNKAMAVTRSGEYMLYICNGTADLNGTALKDGDLVRGKDLNLMVTSDHIHVTVITTEND